MTPSISRHDSREPNARGGDGRRPYTTAAPPAPQKSSGPRRLRARSTFARARRPITARAAQLRARRRTRAAPRAPTVPRPPLARRASSRAARPRPPAYATALRMSESPASVIVMTLVWYSLPHAVPSSTLLPPKKCTAVLPSIA